METLSNLTHPIGELIGSLVENAVINYRQKIENVRQRNAVSSLERRLSLMQRTRVRRQRGRRSDGVRSALPQVLVLNSDTRSADLFTRELHFSLSHAQILYAPTLASARAVLKNRSIDLIVSEELLPDGPISSLQEILGSLACPPSVIVFNDVRSLVGHSLGGEYYRFSGMRVLGSATTKKVERSSHSYGTYSGTSSDPYIDTVIHSVGAEIRDRVNNPLQEIVAMVYVAKATGFASTLALEALESIERTAATLGASINEITEGSSFEGRSGNRKRLRR